MSLNACGGTIHFIQGTNREKYYNYFYSYLLLLHYSLCYYTIRHYVAGGKDYFQTYQTHVPAFLPVPRNITVHEGDTAHLKCRIKDLGTKTVTRQTE